MRGPGLRRQRATRVAECCLSHQGQSALNQAISCGRESQNRRKPLLKTGCIEAQFQHPESNLPKIPLPGNELALSPVMAILSEANLQRFPQLPNPLRQTLEDSHYQPMSAPQNHPLTARGGSRQGISDHLVAQISSQSQRPLEEPPTARNHSDSAAVVTVGFFAFALLVFLIRYLKGRKKTLSPAQYSQLKHHTPCSKCRFFNRNPYLQCAVHPENFDQIDAKDCPDFWAVDQDKFLTK